MYEFPRLEITPGQERVRSQIIGNTGLGKKIQSLLKNQEVAAILVDDPSSIDLSRHSDYVYWLQPKCQTFAADRQQKSDICFIPPVLANYLKSSQAKLIIISDEPITNEPMNQLTNELLTNLLDLGIDACQVFVKDVYGPSVGDSGLSLIWRDLKSKFSVNLPDDDDAEICPIYIDDAAAAIIKISFSTQTYGRTFYVTGADKTTVLSFSYRLREEAVRQTQKLPSINYTQTNLSSPFTVRRSLFTVHDASATRDFLNWRPDTDLAEGLKKLVAAINPYKHEFSRRAGREASDRTAVDSGSAAVELMPAADSSRRTRRNFLKKKTIQRFRRAFVIPAVLATAFFAATLSLPRLLDYLAASLAKTSPDRLARYEALFTLFGRRGQFALIQESAALNLKQSQLTSLVSDILQSAVSDSILPAPDSLTRLGVQSASLLKQLPAGETRSLLGLAHRLLPSVASILNSPTKKTVLIVLQNSAELRPTGGFISAVGFITLQKGKILDIDYQPVDQLDSRLLGVNTPPEPIQKYLGETNWLIRDANWSADPDMAGKKIAALVERATGRRPDAVIFLTTSALESILAQTGGIAAPDGAVWNKLNLADRLVYAQDADSPLIGIAKGLENFIKTNPNRSRAVTGALLALSQNNLLVVSLNPSLDFPRLAEVPTLGRDEGGSDSSDYLQIIDANLGANKADHFVAKEHDIAISLPAGRQGLSDSQTASAITLRYANPPSPSQYPAGTYRDYVRVYLPQDSIITSVVRLSPDGLVAVPTDNSIESGRKSVGWFMEIPPGGQEVFRLEYTRQVKLTPKNQVAAYSLSLRKQPGTAIPAAIAISYPPNLVPLAVSDQVTVAQNKLLATDDGETNLTLNVEFATINQ